MVMFFVGKFYQMYPSVILCYHACLCVCNDEDNVRECTKRHIKVEGREGEVLTKGGGRGRDSLSALSFFICRFPVHPSTKADISNFDP